MNNNGVTMNNYAVVMMCGICHGHVRHVPHIKNTLYFFKFFLSLTSFMSLSSIFTLAPEVR